MTKASLITELLNVIGGAVISLSLSSQQLINSNNDEKNLLKSRNSCCRIYLKTKDSTIHYLLYIYHELI